MPYITLLDEFTHLDFSSGDCQMGYQFRYFVDILELLLLLHLVPDLDPRTNFFRKDFSQVVPFAIMCTLSGALFLLVLSKNI